MFYLSKDIVLIVSTAGVCKRLKQTYRYKLWRNVLLLGCECALVLKHRGQRETGGH